MEYSPLHCILLIPGYIFQHLQVLILTAAKGYLIFYRHGVRTQLVLGGSEYRREVERYKPAQNNVDILKV